jgi:hypothetical protein
MRVYRVMFTEEIVYRVDVEAPTEAVARALVERERCAGFHGLEPWYFCTEEVNASASEVDDVTPDLDLPEEDRSRDKLLRLLDHYSLGDGYDPIEATDEALGVLRVEGGAE